MAITYTALTAGTSDTDGTSVTTAAFTAASDTLLVAFVLTRSVMTADPTMAWSGGGDWSFVTRVNYAAKGSIAMFVHTEASGKASTAAVFTGGGSETFDTFHWSIFELTGADLSGGASGAVRYSYNGQGVSTSGTEFTISIANAMLSDSAAVSAFGCAAGYNMAPRSGWTENHDNTISGKSGMETQRIVGTDTLAGATIAGIIQWWGLAAEIKAASAGGAVPSVGAYHYYLRTVVT